jgi:hypothetical protein
MVSKKDGSVRFCINVKKLNDVTVKEKLPLPRFEDVVDRLEGCEFYSMMDAWSGYWQMKLDIMSSPLVAFTVPGIGGGHYEFVSTPFGPTNALGTFQKRFAQSLIPELGKTVETLLDDAVVHSKTWKNHLYDLRRVLELFRKKKWLLKRKKCTFGQLGVNLLGHVVSKEGVAQDPLKREKMLSIMNIDTKKDLKSWISFIAYYQKFIPHFSTFAKPLYELTTNDAKFVWKEEHQVAMEKLKDVLMKDVVLAIPNINEPFELQTDASDVAMGFVLDCMD